MKVKRQFLLIPVAAMLVFSTEAVARENGANGGRMSSSSARSSGSENLLAACAPATAQTDLDINNVRARIMTGGDMWWDLQNTAKYEIPKGGGVNSLFAGSLWIGGLDAGGQLKVAAMTYRQTGNDFWPGPMDTTSVSTDQTVCEQYDKHWKITRKEVEDFVGWRTSPGDYPNYTVPQSIQNWPGNGDASRGQGHYLAPFYDNDGDGIYDYSQGDYPGYDLGNSSTTGCQNKLFGDQTLWWVFNDKGNVHSETGAQAIGLEIRAQAFAFTTNDEINNMSFYQYQVINRSTFQINDCYFGQWVDADLGYYKDDYVGCDVKRGLGYCYNGVANDGGSATPSPGAYGANPPAIGCDFFQGPIADANDGIDNDRDGQLDENGEQIIMSKFVYYNNDFSRQGNPESATHFYNYLTGFWKDGTPLTYGGNAYGGTTPCDFMFPGDTDPTGWGTGGVAQPAWDETTSGNVPDDRRFLQSAGPFTLKPGAVNMVTVGMVWARASQGGPLASVALMRTTDDKAQALFDNCFKVLDGPDAPDLTLQEMDKEIVLYLNNKPTSNNYLEGYVETDPLIIQPAGYPDVNGNGDFTDDVDNTYNFEGYQIFQLKNAQVTTADLYNPDKARLVAQTDMKDSVTQLVNYTFDQSLNSSVPKDMTIEAADAGLEHSFRITEDQFATGNKTLVNQKQYYFLALSYGYNEFIKYQQDQPFQPSQPTAPSLIGQKQPYKAGRKNIRVYTAIPHIPAPELGGTEAHSAYGNGPKITRLEGNGNGNNVVDLTQSSIDAIMAAPTVQNGGQSRVDKITYENGHSPINVKVIDPLNVPAGEFTVKFWDNPTSGYIVKDTARWTLSQTTPTVRTWNSDKSIKLNNEQIIPELGMSITISQVGLPGLDRNEHNNGFLEASMDFSDNTKRWLTGIADVDGASSYNWIRAGSVNVTSGSGCALSFNDRDNATSQDASGQYEKVLGGTWAPYRLTASGDETANACNIGVSWSQSFTLNKMDNLSSVDIVITTDKSKWSRSAVFETGLTSTLNEGQAKFLNLRSAQSVDKNGVPAAVGSGVSTNESDPNYLAETGMGWFPGYAINVETGERLNIAFGENSALVAEHGRDMRWNPTASEYSQLFDLLWGGMQYIYVFGHNGNNNTTATTGDVPAYDGCNRIRDLVYQSVAQSNGSLKREAFRDAMWVSIPMLSDSKYAFTDPAQMPTDVKVRLRVGRPYKKYYTNVDNGSATTPDSLATTGALPQNMNNPMYSFNTYDLETHTADNETAVNALDLINVVPNPYYAYSGYETSQLDNRIKITNLQQKCTISIYTLSGILVRKMTKDSPQTYVDWDLKNTAGIPVASGLYIIHVDVPGVGEKILKWFGVMRPIDLDAY